MIITTLEMATYSIVSSSAELNQQLFATADFELDAPPGVLDKRDFNDL